MKKKLFEMGLPTAVIVLCIALICWLTAPEGKTISETVTISLMGQEHIFNPTLSEQMESNFTLTTEFPVPIAVSEFSGITMKVNDIPFQSGESGTILLQELKKNAYIHLQFFDLQGNQIGEAKIQTLPEDAAPWRVLCSTGNRAEKYFFDCNRYLYKINGDGELLYYRYCDAEASQFTPFKVDGVDRYAYFVEVDETGVDQKLRESAARGAWMVLDENYNAMDWLEFMVPSQYIPENHPVTNTELLMLGDRHYIVVSYVGMRVQNIPKDLSPSEYGAPVVALVLQEIRDGKLVFEWCSSEILELYGALHPEAGYYHSDEKWLDYAPLDQITADGNLLTCSFIGLPVQVKIDRSKGQTTVVRQIPERVQDAGPLIQIKQWEENVFGFSEVDIKSKKVLFEILSAHSIKNVCKVS